MRNINKYFSIDAIKSYHIFLFNVIKSYHISLFNVKIISLTNASNYHASGDVIIDISQLVTWL